MPLPKHDPKDQTLMLQAACFCAAQFLTSYLWGRISDRVGRKVMAVTSIAPEQVDTGTCDAIFSRLLKVKSLCIVICSLLHLHT